MDKEIYIQTIKKECAFLEKEGYFFNQSENNIYYIKEEETEGFRIRFSWLEYGDSFITHGLTAEKRFNIIEQEIQKVLGDELTSYFTMYKNPLIDYIPTGLKFSSEENQNRFVSNTVNDIEFFGEYVYAFYNNTVLDFFKNYKNIHFVNDQLKELLDQKKIQTVLTSMGNTTILRFYVIAFVSQNKPIMDFFNETYFPYLKENLSNELNRVELNRFEKLLINLQRI